MRIDNIEDCCTPYRKVLHFDQVGIDHLIRLGEVVYNMNCPPLEEHSHKDAFEIVLFQSGCQIYSATGAEYLVKGGEMFVSLPNEPHGTADHFEEKSHFFYLIFHFQPGTDFLGLPPKELDLAGHTLFSLPGRVFPVPKGVFPLLHKIIQAYFSQLPFRCGLIRSYTQELVCALLTVMAGGGQESLPAHDCLGLMTDYIQQNLFQNISIHQLAEYAHLSESRVKQIFRESGITAHDYILRQKIRLAEELLKSTALSITDIAFRLAFGSSQHFAKVFFKYTRQTPSDYRRQHWESSAPS